MFLFLGTNQDNVNDMVKKGRNSKPPRNPHVVGSVHPKSKFTDDEVAFVRTCHFMYGTSVYRLAKEFNVANSTMQRVVSGERYKNV